MNLLQILHLLSLNIWLSHILFFLGLVAISVTITRTMLNRVKIMDTPNERSSHSIATPKSGGLAIVITFAVGTLEIYFLGDATHIRYIYFLGFFISALFIAAISFYDDIQYKSFTVKLGTQILASCILMAFGVVLNEIALPNIGTVQLGWFGYPLTLLWVVGLTNAYNFMDGIDGLAAGTAVLICFFWGFIALSLGSMFVYINCYVIAGGALGFLLYNFPPAKIFMGDVGSAFLGFIFAALAIIAARYDYAHTSFLIMPLLLFHFIFDTSFTFFRRIINKEQVTQAHRTHLYQLFTQLGYSHLQVTLYHYGVVCLQGMGAIFMINLANEFRILVFIPYLLLQLCYAFIIIKKSRVQYKHE